MATRTIRIRFATPEDAAALSEVHDNAWAEAYRGIIPGKALNRMIERRGPQWWRTSLIKGSRILVLDVQDKIAGYASFGPSRAVGLAARGEIYELYLAPEYQGLGFGRRLFAATRRELNRSGMDPVVVRCLTGNERAMDFYAHLGGRPAADGHEVFDGVRCDRAAFLWAKVS
jgi:GNAT superfamily N-acetyltransferase